MKTRRIVIDCTSDTITIHENGEEVAAVLSTGTYYLKPGVTEQDFARALGDALNGAGAAMWVKKGDDS